MHDGLDFQYKTNSHANRLIQFVQGNFVSRHRTTKQLVSHDEQNNAYHYKYSNILELAPLCRDDLVLLPKPLVKALGGIGPLVLIYKMTTHVHMVDIHTMQTHEIDAPTYWKHMFKAMCGRERLTEFRIINIEDVEFDVNTSRAAAKQKFAMVRVEVCRADDYGQHDKTFLINTHLGRFIDYNDTVLGYDLNQMTMQELEDYENDSSNKKKLPDIVLVRKCFPKIRKRQNTRIWKLEHLEKEGINDNNIWEGKKGKKNKGAEQADAKMDADYNDFLQDIEEDPEMRQNINLYRDDDVIGELEKQLQAMSLNTEAASKSPIDQALDKGSANVGGQERKVIKAKRTTDKGKKSQKEQETLRKKDADLFKATLKKKGQDNPDDDSDWTDVEEDFPHVQITELLDNLKLDVGGAAAEDSEEEE